MAEPVPPEAEFMEFMVINKKNYIFSKPFDFLYVLFNVGLSLYMEGYVK